MLLFRGIRTANGCRVEVCEEERGEDWVDLPPRLDLWNHSPDGFAWGYGGSCPAQLALAICAAILHNDEEAVRLHQRFKWAFVARLGRNAWTMHEREFWTVVSLLESREMTRRIEREDHNP